MKLEMKCSVGEPLPSEVGDLPEHADGSPMPTPLFFHGFPLHVVLPADVSPAHERALMAANPPTAASHHAGAVERLFCLQPHYTTVFDAAGGGTVPVLHVSLYLRGGAGPIHRPLHWIGECLPPVAGSQAGLVRQKALALEAALTAANDQGIPCTVMVTGRERRLLLVARTVMHNVVALTWTRTLKIAAGNRSTLGGWTSEECLRRAEQVGCLRPQDPVAVCGESRTVRGRQLQRWLMKRGWLHPRQLATDAASAGGDA